MPQSPARGHRRSWRSAAAFVVSLGLVGTAPGIAQQRFTVGGPGCDYPDLPEAVDAAQDGDVILVEPGRFYGATVRDGVRIIGSPGTVLRSALEFRGLAATTHAAVAGLTLQAPLIVDRCRGTVLVEDCAGEGLPFHNAPGIEIRESSLVVIAGIHGFGYAEILRSTLSMGRASFAGRIVLPTLSIEGSFVQVTHSDVLGANSSATSNPVGRFPPAPAVSVNASALALDARSSLRAGLNLGDNDFAVPALFGSDSKLLLDPYCRVAGTRTGPFAGSGLEAFVRSLPGLDLGSFPPVPGAVSLLQLTAPAGAPVILFAGRPAQPLAMGSLGAWMLDAELSVMLAAGIARPVSGRPVGLFVVPVPLPALPEVQGFSILLQSLAWTDQGPTCGVPAPFVVR